MNELLQRASPAVERRLEALFGDEAARAEWSFADQDKALLPLLYRAWPQGPTLLRAAFLREELRMRAYREEARATLEHLGGLSPLVTGSAALSACVYAPSTRHAGRLDLLLESPGACRQARQILERAGWRDLCTPRGVPVTLSFSWPGPFRADFAELWAAGSPHPWEIGRCLGAGDLLLECLISRWNPRAESFPWSVDARTCLALTEPDLERARKAGCLFLAGRSLAALGYPAPPTRPGRLELDLIAAAARRREGGLLRLLARLREPASFLALARHLLLPSPEYLAWSGRHPLRRGKA